MTKASPFLPHLPADKLRQIYDRAAGNELSSGKMLSPMSSSALVANVFGLFIDQPGELPPLPGTGDLGWPASSVMPEQEVRFPWRGGKHPWLDVLIDSPTHLIGIESKRYEPFRDEKDNGFSDAFWRPVWGDRMKPYEAIRDALRDGIADLAPLDCVQLVKHAFARRTMAQKCEPKKQPVVIYLFAEPERWPNGRDVSDEKKKAHVRAVRRFAASVSGAEVELRFFTYRQLLRSWQKLGSDSVRQHAAAVLERFPSV